MFRRVLTLCGFLLLALACKPEKGIEPQPEQEAFPFTFSISHTCGETLSSQVQSYPFFSMEITSGEEADYVIEYTAEGARKEINPAWVGIKYAATLSNPSYGKYWIEGDVYRKYDPSRKLHFRDSVFMQSPRLHTYTTVLSTSSGSTILSPGGTMYPISGETETVTVSWEPEGGFATLEVRADNPDVFMDVRNAAGTGKAEFTFSAPGETPFTLEVAVVNGEIRDRLSYRVEPRRPSDEDPWYVYSIDATIEDYFGSTGFILLSLHCPGLNPDEAGFRVDYNIDDGQMLGTYVEAEDSENGWALVEGDDYQARVYLPGTITRGDHRIRFKVSSLWRSDNFDLSFTKLWQATSILVEPLQPYSDRLFVGGTFKYRVATLPVGNESKLVLSADSDLDCSMEGDVLSVTGTRPSLGSMLTISTEDNPNLYRSMMITVYEPISVFLIISTHAVSLGVSSKNENINRSTLSWTAEAEFSRNGQVRYSFDNGGSVTFDNPVVSALEYSSANTQCDLIELRFVINGLQSVPAVCDPLRASVSAMALIGAGSEAKILEKISGHLTTGGVYRIWLNGVMIASYTKP